MVLTASGLETLLYAMVGILVSQTHQLHFAYFNPAVQCPDLDSPMSGSLLISGTGAGVYQETVTYACETGFNLVGMSERVCQSNGTWSGSDPTCLSKYNSIVWQLVFILTPPFSPLSG